jgi:PAS domain S-box-containing protein
MISQITPAVNPVFRDVAILIILFLMVIGTLFVYFRLRTGTLRRVRHLLQERVDIKTRQLTQKNVELEKLSLVASKTDNSVLIADEKGKIEWVNDGFFRMTGAPKEVVGKNISSIQVYKDIEKVVKEVAEERHSKIFESHLHNKDGKEVWISSTVTPIFDDENLLKKFLFVDTDITESKKMGNQIVASLKEKDILLKEIHHRVKNNLQIIISLLNLQSGYVKDEQTLRTVKDGQNRVRAMALVHEKFYQADEIGEINFQDNSEKLSYSLRQSNGEPEK